MTDAALFAFGMLFGSLWLVLAAALLRSIWSL